MGTVTERCTLLYVFREQVQALGPAAQVQLCDLGQTPSPQEQRSTPPQKGTGSKSQVNSHPGKVGLGVQRVPKAKPYTLLPSSENIFLALNVSINNVQSGFSMLGNCPQGTPEWTTLEGLPLVPSLKKQMQE